MQMLNYLTKPPANTLPSAKVTAQGGDTTVTLLGSGDKTLIVFRFYAVPSPGLQLRLYPPIQDND